METQTFVCPQSKAPCTQAKGTCVKKLDAQGKTFCVEWVKLQQAEGRKHLEDNTNSATATKSS